MASDWSAHRIRETVYRGVFDAEESVRSGERVMFTGGRLPHDCDMGGAGMRLSVPQRALPTCDFPASACKPTSLRST